MALVTGTGMKTQLGKIADMLQSVGTEKTPLQRRLEQLARGLALASLVLVAVVFILGLLRGENWIELFSVAVAMAVAAVPEGLPAVVTIALALVAQRMLKRKAATNVVPESAFISGTVRTFSDAVTAQVEEHMRRIVQMTAAAYGAESHVDFKWNYPPTVNHPAEAEFAATVMDDIVGRDNVVRGLEPTMGSEDFAFMLKVRPGAYIFIGNGDGSHRSTGHGPGPCMLHNPSYDFNDELIPLGATYWTRLVEKYLAG